MSVKSSPYAKMYLVSPAIYEKLLRCLDESDLQYTESMNKPAETLEDKRPSEKAIEEMHRHEVTSAAKPAITKPALQQALASVPPSAGIMEPNPQDYMPTVIATGRDPHAALGYSVVPESDEDMPLSLRFPQKKMITHNPEKLFRNVEPSFGQLTEPESFDIPEQQELQQPVLQPVPVVHQPVPVVPQPGTSRAAPKRPSVATLARQRVSTTPTCVTTARGKICSVNAPKARGSKLVSVCETCGKTFTRKFDLKRHMLSIHNVELPTSYKRWINKDEDMGEVQGTKRTQSFAGIQNRNPQKVTRISKPLPEQSGSGSFKKWK